jgi:3',5'-cyclic AMP phosphodiesterase CpdA
VSNTEHDQDLTLRDAIVQDAELKKELLGPVNRIIVGGDIAYQGDSAEYAMAEQWLEELRVASGCLKGGILVVPGNHDVNRLIAKTDLPVANAQRAVHTAADKEAELKRQLAFEPTAKEFAKPIEAYNEFARQYDCQIYGFEKMFWRHEIPIDQNVSLALYGLTTTYLSGQGGEDDKENEHLYLSPHQTQLRSKAGMINGVLCHHPPDWLTDKDEVDEAFCNRAHLHFFGHKHRQRISRERFHIRFSAAAVNPDRRERRWEPGYNIVQITTTRENNDLILNFESHLLTWQINPDKLVPKQDVDGSSVFKHEIRLPNFRFAKNEQSATPMIQAEVVGVKDDLVDELRKGSLVLRFWHLSSSNRRDIANKLGLLQEGEMELDETIRYGRVLDRVYEEGLLEQLRIAIQERE